jgi:antitoxin YefM
MKVVTDSHARNALKSLLDTFVHDADVAIISRRDAEGDAVVMSLNHYNSLIETLHLLSIPANAAALAWAIRQEQAGGPAADLERRRRRLTVCGIHFVPDAWSANLYWQQQTARRCNASMS